MSKGKRPPPDEIARLAEQALGAGVEKITAPGGASRESLRIHLAGGTTAIATWRPNAVRRANEAHVLRSLSAAGGPVPRLLGEAGELLFQEDLGSRRLTAALHEGREVAEQAAMAAFGSIAALQRAARRSGLAAQVPVLGAGQSWVARLIGAPQRLARREKLPPPRIDPDRLAPLIATRGRVFVKWDARPGNACLAADGTVRWFDWERCGRREGFEDHAWLMGDENWPWGMERSLELLDSVLGGKLSEAAILRLAAFVSLHGVQRLALIRAHLREHGQIGIETARRYDKLGANPEQVGALVMRISEWSEIVPGLDIAHTLQALPEALFG